MSTTVREPRAPRAQRERGEQVAAQERGFSLPRLATYEWAYVTALLALAARVFVLHLGWNFDDSHINFRYVENLKAGNGWVFNAGEHYNASTSVLNPLLTAIVSVLVGSVPVASHVVGYATLFTGTTLLGLTLLRRGYVVAGTALPVMTLCSPHFMSTWGIETQLFFGLLLLFVAAEMHGRERLSWLALGLLVLTRPDGLVLVALKAAVVLVRRREVPWMGLWIVAAVLLPWALFSLAAFGEVSPGTLSSKVEQAESGFWGEGNVYWAGLTGRFNGQYAATEYLYPAVALVGLIAVLVRRSTRPLAFVAAYAVLQQAGYTILGPSSYDWYYVSVFYGVAFFALLALDAGLAAVWRRASAALRGSGRAVVAGALAVAALAGSAYVWLPRSVPQLSASVLSYKELGRYIAHNAERGDAVMLAEVGTVAYHAGLPYRFVDLTGLASSNPQFYSSDNLDELFANPPRYVILRTETEPREAPTFPTAVGVLERAVFADPQFRQMYCVNHRYQRINDYEYTVFRFRTSGDAESVVGPASAPAEACDFTFRRVGG
jgi:hypothetical protein